MADIIINIVQILDSAGNVCYPQTNGEAVSVQYGAGEEKVVYTLDELLSSIFKKVTTDITPDENVSASIGTPERRFTNLYVVNIDASEIKAKNMKADTKAEAKLVSATEQLQINGVTFSKNASGRIVCNAGIEGAVWN